MSETPRLYVTTKKSNSLIIKELLCFKSRGNQNVIELFDDVGRWIILIIIYSILQVDLGPQSH